MSPEDAGCNPGHLKVELAARGVRLDRTLRTHADAPRTTDDGSVRDVELVLPHGVFVTAPVDEGDSPYVLSGEGEHANVRKNGTAVEVRVVPEPGFYRRVTTSGLPMRRVGEVHGSFIAVNPGFACGYSLRGAPCRFCRTGSGIALSDGFPMSVQDVTQVVRAAFAEGAADFVYFNSAYVGSEDAGIAFLEPYIRAVKRQFNTLVAVQLHPPKSDRWIDRTYAMGVDAVSYAIEIHDAEMLARRCAGRVRYIGRERYYEALTYAATVFPSGTVWSDLIVGMESIDSTMQGIDALTAAGVLPVLSIVRPSQETSGNVPRPAALDAVAPAYTHLYRTVRDARINMGWIRDLSFAITPLEARFFAGADARVAVAMQQFYRSRLGSVTTRNLSRLRRRLRVRTVSDSFDSSHL